MTEPNKPMSVIRALTELLIGLVLATFLAGVTVGYLDGMADHGQILITPGLGGAIVATAIIAITLMRTARSLPNWNAMSKRRRYYWASLGGSTLMGVVVGIMLALEGDAGTVKHLSDPKAPFSPEFAYVASALWLFGMTMALFAYHRGIDDHEERAWLWAGLAGWYAFIISAPAWWVLHRAAIVPPVDAMTLFLISLIVNAIVWLWLKFR